MVENIKSTEPIGNSHHATITFQIKAYQEQERTEEKISYKWESGDYTAFNRFMEQTNWDEQLQDSVDQDWQRFSKIIKEGMSKFISSKKMSRQHKTKPLWMTEIFF